MIFISHRGNLIEKEPTTENTLEKIIYVLSKGYHVEIDIWKVDGKFYLGHDNPAEEIQREFLLFNNKKLWCHAKNLNALESMLSLGIINCFWHQNDDYTITSKGFIWTYPGKQLSNNSVVVLTKDTNYSLEDLKKCYGICSDNIEDLKNKIVGSK
jgi:hypothetical protein